MPSVINRSFAAGEISPALHARSDMVKYQTGLKTCRNFMVMKSGGVENRPGFRFICAAKQSATYSRGIPFVYTADDSYRLEFGHLYMRIVRHGVLLQPSASAWLPSHAYVLGDAVSVGAGYYYARTAHTSGATFDPLNWYAMVGAYEIPTPYTAAELPELNYDQSADVMTLTHPSHAPAELRRYGHVHWTLTTMVIGTGTATPVGLSGTVGASGSLSFSYRIARVDDVTGEQSLATVPFTLASAAAPTSSAPISLTWTAFPATARVYKAKNGRYGFIGDADGAGSSFKDTGIDPDVTSGPPVERNPFSSPPATSAYFQQRHFFGGMADTPERIEGSRIGLFHNFMRSEPGEDDDAVSFTLVGQRVNEIRHLIDLGSLVVLTSSAEIVVLGNQDGVITPTAINARTRGYSGASKVRPAVIQDSAVFVQARGMVLRDLKYQPEADGYVGRDLTVFSTHLFEGHTVSRLAYAENPSSVLWCLRDDGVLLALTYLREHELWGWHRHDTDGAIEDICVVPEGSYDVLYIVARREIDGATRRYVERLDPRWVSDSRDWCFVDSALTYDGRNHDPAFQVTLTAGTLWTQDEEMTVNATAGVFLGAVAGDAVLLHQDDETLRLRITGILTSNQVRVRSNRTVPEGLRNVATESWGLAKSRFNLAHLAGRADIVALADSKVVGPLSSADGIVTLPRAAEVVTMGLPIDAEIETLPIDSAQGETLRNRQERVREVTLLMRRSRGGWIGTDRAAMGQLEQRDGEPYDDPVHETHRASMRVESTWSKDQTVVVQQRDPLPMTVLAVVPHVAIGGV